MGMFGNVFNRGRNVTVPSDPSSTLGQADTLPASMGGRIAASGNAALDKATQIYQKNPKLVGGLAAVGAAILLSRMKRGGIR